MLNTFAYTCGFSVCAALAGARVTSLDLSRKYLDWGRRNFTLNGLEPAAHEFLYGDTLRLVAAAGEEGPAVRRRAARSADVLAIEGARALSRREGSGAARRGGGGGVATRGVVFASSNAARWAPAEFLAQVESGLGGPRVIQQRHYAPQPPDFPVHRDEPAYLKTIWLRVFDEGFHPMTVYFPLVVHGAMLIEPTETESKDGLDRLIASLRSLATRARDCDPSLKTAPHFAPRRRLDETLAARKPVLTWREPVEI